MTTYGASWVGRRVSHNVYGDGVVVRLSSTWPFLVVQFDSGEIRELMPQALAGWADA